MIAIDAGRSKKHDVFMEARAASLFLRSRV